MNTVNVNYSKCLYKLTLEELTTENTWCRLSAASYVVTVTQVHLSVLVCVGLNFYKEVLDLYINDQRLISNEYFDHNLVTRLQIVSLLSQHKLFHVLLI